MVDNILRAIDEKAEEQIAKILQEKEEAILTLQQQHNLAVKAKLKEQKEVALKEAAKEIEDFEKILQLKLNFKIQEGKNQLVKEAYEKAKEKITIIDGESFKKLIKHLAGYLPEKKKGHIEAGEKTAKVLKGFLASEVAVESNLDEEGFIFKSHDVEIDLRISQIFLHFQETTNPELVKILFS
ncbi:MAG: hypothetical protein PHW31_02160 [Candidatus Pacebacteria bacterium]|nr:hypothetical protein [Candidatus Paceibacterota bacterium]